MNAGFGLWQLAFGSKAALNATNDAAARAAMRDAPATAARFWASRLPSPSDRNDPALCRPRWKTRPCA
ncbi:MAG: hypothetical protein EP307_00025 [Rhodobacteraceae bacterium]|nr:MAG: hypothetical protein EP307_00025 [Paracoccaceae bacterium]